MTAADATTQSPGVVGTADIDESPVTAGQLLDADQLGDLAGVVDRSGVPLGPRRLYAWLTRADRDRSDFSAFETTTAERAPWPLLERPYQRRVVLPRPADRIDVPMSDALAARRSKHHAAAEPLLLEVLSTCLHWSAGIREEMAAYNRRTYPVRYAPSAGGLQPIDLYLVANNVGGLAQGLYYYHPGGHELRLLDDGNLRRPLVRSAIFAEWLGYASAVLVLVGDLDRVEWKYGERGYRFMHVDAGVMCQNLYLTGAAHGLHTCAVAAYYDDEIATLLGIDGDRQFPVVLFAYSVPPAASILSEPVTTVDGA